MSATGRGKRLGGKADNFKTPAWCVHRLLDAWQPPRTGRWLEPCAGDGAIIRASEGRYGITSAIWDAVEIRASQEEKLRELRGPRVFIGDFLKVTPADLGCSPAAIITNPPFSIAQEIIAHARAAFPEAALALLLRVNFLASDHRAQWLTGWTPDVYVLPNRPSFKKGAPDAKGRRSSTDATEYGWFVWPDGRPRSEGRVVVLPVTPLDERQGRAQAVPRASRKPPAMPRLGGNYSEVQT